MRLKAVQAALLCGVLAAPACSDTAGSGPDPLPAGFTFVGTWQLHVDAATDCWAAFDTRISIPQASLTAGVNGTSQLMNTDGWWFLGGTGPDVHATLSGTVNQSTGVFALRLWNTTAARQGRFEGVASSATRLGGTFTDPDAAFRTIAGTHPCSAPAHAIKD
ncbi:MAG TPA: hypothetical protein VGO40_09490 [Longimicrobium sp.]|jgi:hypothetical protein|nr:hypothetical protein [Longimicrobium sp.]